MNRKYTQRRRSRQPMASVVSFPNLSRIESVPKSRLVGGAVVWAHIPFEEGEGEKTRPAVVVERRGRTVVVKPATTSSTWRRYPHRYVEIRDIDVAGLRRPTAVRSEPVIIDLIEVVDLVGTLSEEDAAAVLLGRPEPVVSHVG